MDQNDPKYSNDPTLPPNERTPGWEPVVGTTYEPQDERTVDHEHDVEHVDHDTSATHEHGNEAGAGTGALGGAAAGALMGGAVAGPPGAVVGGAVGAGAGAGAGDKTEEHVEGEDVTGYDRR